MINLLKNETMRKFLLWCLCGIIIFLVGHFKVFASTYTANEFTAQLYDNYGSTLSAVSTSSNGSYWTGYIPTMVANSAGAAWGVSSPIPLLANHTYTVSINPGSYIGTSILSTYNRIGVGTSMDSAKTSYQNGGVYINYSKALGNGYIQYAFTPSSAGSFIVIPFSLNTSGDTVRFDLYDVIIEDLGSSGVTQDDINSSLSNQTNIIQNTINDMENNINNTINDNFNDCHDSSNLFNMNNLNIYDSVVTYSEDSFTISSDNEWGHAEYVIYLPAGTYTIGGNITGTYTQIGIVRDGSYLTGGNVPITFYSNGNTFRFTFYGTTSGNAPGSTTFSKIQLVNSTSLGAYEPFGQICKNKIDATNDKLDNLHDSINDDNTDGANDKISNFFSDFSTKDHGGLSGIITAPLEAINQMLNKNCSPMSATYKGKKIELPCGYDFWAKMPQIQDFLNVVLGGMLCYNILKKLYKLIERLKNPEDDRVDVMDL